MTTFIRTTGGLNYMLPYEEARRYYVFTDAQVRQYEQGTPQKKAAMLESKKLNGEYKARTEDFEKFLHNIGVLD